LLDAEFGKNLEPEGEIGKRGNTREKGGDHKVPPLLGKNERRQAERQEDEHEGGTGGLIEQKHGKEDEEETLSGDGQQHARPQSPVARPRDISFLQ
jgi:hypothetical protein